MLVWYLSNKVLCLQLLLQPFICDQEIIRGHKYSALGWNPRFLLSKFIPFHHTLPPSLVLYFSHSECID